MINAILEVLKNIAIVIGGAVVISLIGVSILLLGDNYIEKWKERVRREWKKQNKKQ